MRFHTPMCFFRLLGRMPLILLLLIFACKETPGEQAPPAKAPVETTYEASAPGPSAADASADAKAADETANPLARFAHPIEADKYNPLASTPAGRAQKPRRGGVLRVRTPAEFGNLNPLLSNTRGDRDVTTYLFDSLMALDTETLEYRPRMAWSWEEQDVVIPAAGERKLGVIVERTETSIRFAEGATRRTFLKNDLESFTAGPKGAVVVKSEKGGGAFHGKVTEYNYTLQIDTSTDPKASMQTIALDSLARYTVTIGSRQEDRPAAKPRCFFRFHLRPGLKWEDGQPLTAEDWVFAVDTVRNPNIREAASLRNYYNDLESVRSALDGKAVEFLWSKPYFKALEFSGSAYVLPRHVFKPESYAGDPAAFADAFTKNEYSQKPLGCGPYKIEEWKTDRLSIVRNPNYYAPSAGLPYFSPDQPYLDRIVWVVINNRTAALKELQKGTIDLDADIEPDTWVAKETQTEEFTKRIVRAEHTGLLYTYIGWNLDRPWFQDARVRKALAMLIPADRIVRDIHFGLARRVNQPFFIEGPVYDHSLPLIPYDPSGARRMLREAGWLDRNRDGVLENELELDENGKKIRKTVDLAFEFLIHTARAYHAQIANIIKEEMGKVGIRVTVRPMEFATFATTVQDRNFDACRFAWGTDIDDDPYQIWHSSQAIKGGSNYLGFKNTRCDEIMEQCREEFDPIRRWTLYREMSRIVYEEQPSCFLFGFPEQIFYSNRFRGVKLYSSQQSLDFTEWWMSEAP